MSQDKYYCNLYEFLKRRIHALVGKLENRCFCWYPAAMWCSWKGHQHGVSIQSFINFGKPFFPISRIWNISQTWFLARVFVYLSFFISQILVLLYWMVCIFIFHCVTVQAENTIWIAPITAIYKLSISQFFFQKLRNLCAHDQCLDWGKVKTGWSRFKWKID